MTGNRGILHVADGVMGQALWKHRAWICCTLDWQGRKRSVMSGRKWTELFFLDEATALAAGHRPCAYCRWTAWRRWADAWAEAHGTAKAPEMDAVLHAARAVPGARQMRDGPVLDMTDLPNGSFVAWRDAPHLVEGDALYPWTIEGYSPAIPRPKATATLLTPLPALGVLRAGYVPHVHPSLAQPPQA